MRNTLLILALLLWLPLTAPADKRFETEFSKEIGVVAFYPRGEGHGYYFPGETPTFTLVLQNRSQSSVRTECLIVVKDSDDKTVATLPPSGLAMAPRQTATETITVPAQERRGFFILDATITVNGKKAVTTQSAFAIVDPPPAQRDPFFGLDQNGIDGELVDAYKRLGAGSLGVAIHRPWIKDPKTDVAKMLRSKKWQALLNSDFKLVAHLSPTVYGDKRVAERIAKGMPALCDEEVEHYREFVRAFSSLTKDRIRLWLIQTEYDAHFRHPSITYGDGTAELANTVLMTRIGYKEIKKANPDANVAVLGMMGIDYYGTEPKFKLTRMILDDLKENFDLLCIDGYNGNWNGLIGELPPPENGFRNFLADSAKLSASYTRPGFVINAENGYAYDYFSAFNSPIAKQVAQYTARRLIINKSAPSPYSSWHMGSSHGAVWRLNTKRALPDKPLLDMAMGWKSINREDGKYTLVPKMPGTAYAVAARKLAFARPHAEKVFGTNIYAYTFSKPDGISLAALWSIDEPVKFQFDLPAAAEMTDMTGNKSTLKKGKTELLLTQSPIYLTVKSEVAPLALAIAAAQIPVRIPVIGEGVRSSGNSVDLFLRNCENRAQNIIVEVPGTVRVPVALAPFESKKIHVGVPENIGTRAEAFLITADKKKFSVPLDLRHTVVPKLTMKPNFDGSGKWFASAGRGRLVTPDDVWPKNAMIPEMGLFKLDGGDISAEYAFGYDSDHLYLGVDVQDKRHLQRYSGKDLWKDDSLQFVLSLRSDLPPARLRGKSDTPKFGKQEYNIGVALGEKGQELFAYNNGPKSSGLLPWPAKVTRKGDRTLYEVAIPWKEVSMTPPSAGDGVRFGFVVTDNNRNEDAVSKYQLTFSHGICGGQDPARLKTLIFQ